VGTYFKETGGTFIPRDGWREMKCFVQNEASLLKK